MLTRSDLRYARRRREAIQIYCPGSGPKLSTRKDVDASSLSGGGLFASRRDSRLFSVSSATSSNAPPGSPTSVEFPVSEDIWTESTTSATNSSPPHPGSPPQPPPQKRLVFNVSGTIIETYASTMARFPDSLLGDPARRQRFWNEERKEYYLDRHVPTFEAVFQFYQTGLLHRPLSVPLFTFVEELEYYEFNSTIMNMYLDREGYIVDKNPVLPKDPMKKKVWVLFEYPKSSRLARVLALASIFALCVSIASFCAETMPEFHHYHCHNASSTDPGTGEVTWHQVPNLTSTFFLVESVCVAWFTLELLARLWSCPHSYYTFVCNRTNQIDIITVVPYAMVLVVIVATKSCYIAQRSASLLIFRVLRILRIFKLTKHLRALHIVLLSLRHSVRELRLFLFLFLLACVIMAFAIHAMEGDDPDALIDTVPEGIWWAVATMTTVGYGDVYPVSMQGKVVGVFCFITGLLVIALPTPPIVSNFNHFYRVETGRGCDTLDNG